MDNNTDPLTEKIHEHLKETKAVILQGPPGTGKTYHAKQVVEAVAEEGEGDDYRWKQEDNHLPKDKTDENWHPDGQSDDENGPDVIWELVQFHSNYTYEDFVRGVTVDTDSDGISFVNRDGILIELARVAQMVDDETKVVLILDEINRGNVGSVLGESILAIEGDKRGDEWPVRVKYPPGEGWENAEDEDGRAISLPENLWVIGTMNTADESVALIDHAIRRRFRFINLQPDINVLMDEFENEISALRSVGTLFCHINRHLPADYELGHTYFQFEKDTWERSLKRNYVENISTILREYCKNGVIIKDEIKANDYSIFSESYTDEQLQEKINRFVDDRKGVQLYEGHIKWRDNKNDPSQSITRHFGLWYEYGYVAGGRSSDASEGIRDLGTEADIFWIRGSQNDMSGVFALGINKIDMAFTNNTPIENFIDWRKHNPVENETQRRFSYNDKKSEVFTEVEWAFVVPLVADNISKKEQYDEDMYESIENAAEKQSFCVNKDYKNKNRIPGLAEFNELENLVERKQFYIGQATADQVGGESWGKLKFLFLVSFFTKEYRFCLEKQLPREYVDQKNGFLRKLNSELDVLCSVDLKNAELSVVESENDSETPYRTRVWIPVFSDPFAIRDDELLFDGGEIHIVSRIKNNIHDLPEKDPDHLYRKCNEDSEEEESSKWKYIGSQNVGDFLRERVVNEITKTSDDETQLKILYYCTLFYHRNIRYISDDAMPEENSKNESKTLIKQFIPDSESIDGDSRQEWKTMIKEFIPDSEIPDSETLEEDSKDEWEKLVEHIDNRQDGYEIIGKHIASKLNRTGDSGWDYNALPEREQILPYNDSIDAPLPDHNPGSSRSQSENKSELFENHHLECLADAASIDDLERRIFGPKADDNSGDWNVVDTNKLRSELDGFDKNDSGESDRMFNLKEILQLQIGYDEDNMPGWYEKLAGEQDE